MSVGKENHARERLVQYSTFTCCNGPSCPGSAAAALEGAASPAASDSYDGAEPAFSDSYDGAAPAVSSSYEVAESRPVWHQRRPDSEDTARLHQRSAESRCRWRRPAPSPPAGLAVSPGHGPGRPSRPAGAECCGTPGRGAAPAVPAVPARRPRLRPPSALRHLVLLLLLSSVFRIAGACSSRANPKPRGPSASTRRPYTFNTEPCPEMYQEWYCLNEAKCFKVNIGHNPLYNCECADGFMGQRCQFKDPDGSYTHLRRPGRPAVPAPRRRAPGRRFLSPANLLIREPPDPDLIREPPDPDLIREPPDPDLIREPPDPDLLREPPEPPPDPDPPGTGPESAPGTSVRSESLASSPGRRSGSLASSPGRRSGAAAPARLSHQSPPPPPSSALHRPAPTDRRHTPPPPPSASSTSSSPPPTSASPAPSPSPSPPPLPPPLSSPSSPHARGSGSRDPVMEQASIAGGAGVALLVCLLLSGLLYVWSKRRRKHATSTGQPLFALRQSTSHVVQMEPPSPAASDTPAAADVIELQAADRWTPAAPPAAQTAPQNTAPAAQTAPENTPAGAAAAVGATPGPDASGLAPAEPQSRQGDRPP